MARIYKKANENENATPEEKVHEGVPENELPYSIEFKGTTVKELIEKLKGLPEDMPVKFLDNKNFRLQVDPVYGDSNILYAQGEDPADVKRDPIIYNLDTKKVMNDLLEAGKKTLVKIAGTLDSNKEKESNLNNDKHEFDDYKDNKLNVNKYEFDDMKIDPDDSDDDDPDFPSIDEEVANYVKAYDKYGWNPDKLDYQMFLSFIDSLIKAIDESCLDGSEIYRVYKSVEYTVDFNPNEYFCKDAVKAFTNLIPPAALNTRIKVKQDEGQLTIKYNEVLEDISYDFDDEDDD